MARRSYTQLYCVIERGGETEKVGRLLMAHLLSQVIVLTHGFIVLIIHLSKILAEREGEGGGPVVFAKMAGRGRIGQLSERKPEKVPDFSHLGLI